MTPNPAAVNGWVKSTDPKTGRVFYANHVTRKTQWEKPEGWLEIDSLAPPPNPYQKEKSREEEDELPSNWEMMVDPTSGKPFYVDHDRKVTTWVRPTVKKAEPLISHAPAPVATSATYGSTVFPSASSNNSSTRSAGSSFQQPSSSYYSQSFSQPHQWHQEQVDFSDSMPSLEFAVKKVDDALRSACAHCGSVFTMSKRRHHCRLCGDVFCDACSSHRVELPLEGAEFEKPVRVCDFCFQDVDKGNFFSTRRYFTPIELYKPELEEQEEGGVATSNNVNAALAALTSDLDQMLHNPDTTLEEKITIPPKVFIPALIRHLKHRDTADRTVRALASVLALESIAGKVEYAHAVYMYGQQGVINDLLGILERSGSDRRTLFIHEQAARSLFYLTDPQVLTSLERRYGNSNDSEEHGGVEALDIPRSLQNVLDHSSVSKNPNLQRWSTSTVRNLVLEDQRRACMSINQMAATVACGEAPQDDEYQSILDQFAQTGGIMILCSLIGADDSDTRAHATGALGAILSATRAIDASRAALAEMTGGVSRDAETKDGEIIRAIIAGGGCGSSVSQLLLSADNTVAGMGCELCASLVGPLLSKPDATANLPTDYDWRTDRDGMGACREAALEIVCGSCLPALLSLLREHQIVKRPVELQTAAMETLSASVLAVGAIGKAWSRGKYEEGLTEAPSKLKEALSLLNEEGVIDAAVEVMQSSSGQSLGSSADTPASRMREGAGIILSSLTSCSAEAIMDLRSRNILPSLLMASNDASINTPSTLRGDAAPRCLGVLETMSSVMIFAWQNPSGSSSELLDSLIAVLDVGAISFLSKVLSIKIEFDSTDKAVGGMKARAACFRLLCCLFGIALTDETAIGMRRLMDAVDADAYAYAATSRQHRGPQNIVEAVLGSLQVATSYARKVLMGTKSHDSHYHTALMDMVEASLLATSSMCGSSIAPGGSEGRLIKGESFLAMRSDDFVSRRRDICSAACDVVVRGSRSGPMLLPTMLVGGFGEGVVRASLRLSLAIAQNGTETQHAKLALSGIMVPISDQMRDSLSSGDLYKFSAALTLVRFCGPHIASGESGGLQSVRDAIRVVTNVLTLPIPPDISIEQTNTQESLKSECISALESLSKNAALWSAISSDALPSLVAYLRSSSNVSSANLRQQQTHCAALRAVLQIVQVPSHALSAAEAGMAEPLGKLLLNRKSPSSAKEDVENESTILALEVLHAIAKNPESRRRAALLDVGVARDICCAIANAATSSPNKPVDGRANITLIGLDVLHSVLSDVEGEFDTQTLLESPGAIAFLDAVASEPAFVRALCATILMESGMQLNGLESGSKVDIPSLYGSPLVLVHESFRGFANTHEAAAALFMSAAVYACAIDSTRSESFWNSCLLRDIASTTEPCERARAAATLCAYVLSLIDGGFAPFLPRKKVKEADFITLCKPLVLHQLLEALRDSMREITAFRDEEANDYVIMLIVDYNIPKICLTMWEDSALLDVAFELLKLVVALNPDDVLHLFVASREVLLSLFDKLNINPASGIASDVSEIRKFLASILGKLADSGLLKDTVERFSLRSSAIGALAAACLAEEETTEDDEDTTSNRLASALMRCLVELCTIKTSDGSRSEITLSSVEAEAIARNLGRKICHMVLSRFLERAKLQQYDIEEEDDILEAPDVAMLCAISQHDNALDILRAIGGLHALSQIASEGDMSAVMALKKACEKDPAIILEADTYKGITALFTKDDHDAPWRESASRRDTLECAGYSILGQVCSLQRGRRLIGNSDDGLQCVNRALEIVSSLVPPIATDNLQIGTVGSDDAAEGDHSAINDNATPVVGLTELNDSSLGSAVLSFLSEVIHVERIRNAVIEDTGCLEASFVLALCESHPLLQFEATKLLKSLSPYATRSKQALNSNKIADVLNNVLKVDASSDLGSDSKIDMNTLYNTAIEGINLLFRCLSSEMQLTLAKAIGARLSKLVKSLAAGRANSSTGAKLACNACNILLIARCRDATEEVFSRQLLVTLINLLQWRYDTRTRLLEGTTTLWNAAVTYCLQILSMTLSTTNECLSEDGVQVKQLAATTLMMVRPGKAPRKAPDVLAALKQAIESGDAAAKLAAEQISRLLLEVDR